MLQGTLWGQTVIIGLKGVYSKIKNPLLGGKNLGNGTNPKQKPFAG